MTNYTKKSKTSNLQVSMKKALAALMLAVLVPGHNVLAQTGQVETANAQTETVAAADTTTAPSPTVQDVLLNVCQSKGYGEDCAKTLLGMLWNESNNVSTAIGDKGKARGYFQIWYKLHNITIDCAEDLVCSATWTLNNLERHQYPKYVAYAVQCHNGCNINNGYAAKALRNGKKFWDQPLEIDQAAPIQLADAQ